jgi:hypothetical protein
MHEEEDIKKQQAIGNGQLANDETNSSAESIAEVEQQETYNEKPETNDEKPETENMEVHHHTHTSHGKKTWKEYFWEFLMLFLAVFCGFLAEYQLEHKIERDRERQYIQSLITDLKTDIVNIDTVQKRNMLVKQKGDSLFTLLSLSDYSNSTNSIYYLGRSFSGRTNFNMTDGTLKQLNNAGGLRLIRKKNIVDSLQAYQFLYSEVVKFQELKEIQLQSYRDVMCKVFDVQVFETMVNGETVARPVGNPVLFSQNKELINELLMKAHFVKRNNANIMNLLDRMKQQALNLQETIKKEYHLK